MFHFSKAVLTNYNTAWQYTRCGFVIAIRLTAESCAGSAALSDL